MPSQYANVSLAPATRRVAEALALAVPRVTVAAMVVVPVPAPVAEHPEAVWAADATVVSAEAHVQAGSALASPPVISSVNSAVWPASTVSAAGESEAVSGGGVTRRLADAVAVSAPRVTVAAMVVVPVPVPVAEHPEAVWAADATVVSAEAHVQAGSALASPPVISSMNSVVWPVSTVSAAGERTAVSGGGVTRRLADAVAVSAPRVTVAAMVVVPVPVPVAEHPEAVWAADATVVSAEAHVQAGSALASPPVISSVNSAVWPASTVSAAGESEAVSGGGVTRRLADAVAVSAPRVTVAAMVVVPVPVPVAEHPEAVWAADATVVSAEAHVQAGSALASPPVISSMNSVVWPVSTVSAAGESEAVSGGGVTRRLADAVAVSAPRVTVAAMVVVPVPVPVAEHPEAVWVADATVVSAEAHVQAGSALASPPVISSVNSAVWPASTVSAAGESEAVSGGGGGGGVGAVGLRVPDSEQPTSKKMPSAINRDGKARCMRSPTMLAMMEVDSLLSPDLG